MTDDTPSIENIDTPIEYSPTLKDFAQPKTQERKFITFDALLDFIKWRRIIECNIRTEILDGKVLYVVYYENTEILM